MYTQSQHCAYVHVHVHILLSRFKLEVNCTQLPAERGRVSVGEWLQLTRKDGGVLVRGLPQSTKVYSRSVDPRKLHVGVKYYVIHQNHILRLLVCTCTARSNRAQKCTWLRLLCSCLLCIFFRGGQANPIQTS